MPSSMSSTMMPSSMSSTMTPSSMSSTMMPSSMSSTMNPIKKNTIESQIPQNMIETTNIPGYFYTGYESSKLALISQDYNINQMPIYQEVKEVINNNNNIQPYDKSFSNLNDLQSDDKGQTQNDYSLHNLEGIKEKQYITNYNNINNNIVNNNTDIVGYSYNTYMDFNEFMNNKL